MQILIFQIKLIIPFANKINTRIHKRIEGIVRKIDNNKIIDANKSNTLNTSPNKTNNPFMKRSMAGNNRNW